MVNKLYHCQCDYHKMYFFIYKRFRLLQMFSRFFLIQNSQANWQQPIFSTAIRSRQRCLTNHFPYTLHFTHDTCTHVYTYVDVPTFQHVELDDVPPSPPPIIKKLNARFWITFNF